MPNSRFASKIAIGFNWINVYDLAGQINRQGLISSWIVSMDNLSLNGCFSSAPHDLDDDLPLPPPVIEVNEDNLLPGSERESPLDEGDGERGFHEGRPDMGKPIAIAPAFVVFIDHR